MNAIKDDRSHFLIETFGFNKGGILEFNVTNFSLLGKQGKFKTPGSVNLCFIITVTEVDESNFNDEEQIYECNMTNTLASIKEVKVIRLDDWKSLTYRQEITRDGFYNIYFANGEKVENNPRMTVPVDFSMRIVNYNKGMNYLPIGKLPLPKLYLFFTFIYMGLVGLWVFNCIGRKNVKVQLIHWLMTALISLKTLSLLFKSIDYHYLNVVGHPGGWATIYYLINFIKGVTMFAVIALIGTGYQFIKPYLSERDKKVFLFVVPLQILDNIALIVIDEMTPGTQGWETWKSIFRVIDIVCCGAILIPIIWSIKHLQDAAGTDGKASKNLNKLQMFRQYYLIVVSYIYFTRIIVYLFDAGLPYQYVWLGDLFSQTANLIFFVVTGYKFQPTPDNPYLKISSDDEGTPLEEVLEKDTSFDVNEDK
eukprot:TRINITY_DN13620_c0_g1_i1.p1 TRINITY_DN13620_c0_g1~~TRINITY_DN13620_c0_g1_i1.p1  ORF type:complete len:446 (-),score=87.91 TRINITY_DN13620_c0_g1_i1:78-1343(-)